ncbi:9061_t:CDS:1, partial [Paraglomus brasilianum]
IPGALKVELSGTVNAFPQQILRSRRNVRPLAAVNKSLQYE